MRSKFIPLDQQRARDRNLKLNYCRGISTSLIYFQEHFHGLGTLDGWRRVMVDFWSSNEGYCQRPTASPDLLTMRYPNCVSDNNGYYWTGGGEVCSHCNSHRSVRTNKTLVEIVAYFLCCSHFINLFHQRRHVQRKVAALQAVRPCRESSGIAQRFPNCCTVCRWVVNCNHRPLYPRGKNSRHPSNRELGGPPVAVLAFWRRENLLFLPEIEFLILQPVAYLLCD